MDTLIQLGSFVFRDHEIPESINIGGNHQLVKQMLIGGNRDVNAMGKDDDDITWSGLITGADALQRMQQLNSMRCSGQSFSLKWFNLNYSVVIQSFTAHTEKFHQISFEIKLCVLIDNSNPISTTNLVGFNEAINADLAQAKAIAANLVLNSSPNSVNDNQDVADAVDDVDSAVSQVDTFNGASPQDVSMVSSKIAIAQTAIKTSLSSIEAALFGILI